MVEERELAVNRYGDAQGSGAMTLADAYEHHRKRLMDFVIRDGEIVEIWAAGKSLWEKKKSEC